MPAYDTPPNPTPPLMLLSGVPAYAFGSFPTNVPLTRMQINNNALTSNVVTLTVTVREGNIPAVGSLITTSGQLNASGAYNVSGVALTGVTIDATTGKGTVTFALTHANIASGADAGDAYVAVPEVGETLAVGKSQAFAVQHTLGGGYGISWAYTLSGTPSTIAIQLEGAIDDIDSEYTIIGTSQTTTTGYNETIGTVPENVNFLRLNITATTGGTTPKVVGKILKS